MFRACIHVSQTWPPGAFQVESNHGMLVMLASPPNDAAAPGYAHARHVGRAGHASHADSRWTFHFRTCVYSE